VRRSRSGAVLCPSPPFGLGRIPAPRNRPARPLHQAEAPPQAGRRGFQTRRGWAGRARRRSAKKPKGYQPPTPAYIDNAASGSRNRRRMVNEHVSRDEAAQNKFLAGDESLALPGNKCKHITKATGARYAQRSAGQTLKIAREQTRASNLQPIRQEAGTHPPGVA